jgi:hypothetical protein
MADTHTLVIALFWQHHLDSSAPMIVFACTFHATSGMPKLLMFDAINPAETLHLQILIGWEVQKDDV